jgi:O-antigen/teichoic acid export membrane protein
MGSRVEISKRLVMINSASGVLARVLNIAMLLWLQQYLLRRITPGEYSLLPVLMGIIMLLPLFTSVLTSGLGRFLVAAYARGDDRGITQIVSTMFPLLLGASFFLMAGGLVFARYVDHILSIPPERVWDARMMTSLLALSVAIRPMFAAFGLGLYVRQKFVLQNIINVGTEVFRLLLMCVLLLGISARVLWVVVANVTAEIAMMSILAIVSRRLIPALRFRAAEIRWGRARELVTFGGWNFLGIMAYRLRETAIPVILNKLATPIDVTVYYLGCLPRRQIDQWTDVVGAPLYPVVTGMHATGAEARLRSIYLRGGRMALWAVLAVALPAIIYSQTFMRLYVGKIYLDAAIVMVLTLAILPLSTGTYMTWQIANASGRVRPTGTYSLVTQLIIVAGTLYLVGMLDWGGVGAALAAFTITGVAILVRLWPLGLMLADVKFGAWVRETLLPGLAPGCLAAVVWSTLNAVVRPDSWIALGWCTMAGLLCYGAILLGFCLEPTDRRDLVEVFGRARSLLRRRPAAPGESAANATLGAPARLAAPAEATPGAFDDGTAHAGPLTGGTTVKNCRDG